MDTWADQVNRRARLLMDQVIAARLSAQESGVDLGWLEQQYRDRIAQLYAEEFASARLRDTSDLIVRAEGPGADHEAPSLHSFTWLTDHIRNQLARLSTAVLPLAVADAKRARKRLRWSFMGYAPGSIMMGFALRHPESMPGFEDSDKAAFALITSSAQSIATVPQFVQDNGIDMAIREAIPDPALRDTALLAAGHIAPTAQSGIHTIEISARNGARGNLSQRERMVLKTVTDNPTLRQKKAGTFVGSLRAADLDTGRAVLRDVAGLESAIRCILGKALEMKAKELFGRRVKVSGDYESDREGRPRLLHIDSIEPDTTQASLR